MYISRIYIRNYRSFKELDLFIHNGEPLTIIGRNGAGKSNLLNAVRLVLDHKVPHWEKQLQEADFCWHDSKEPWRKGEEIVITVTFSGLVSDNEVRAFLDAIAGRANKSEGEDPSNPSLEAQLSFVFAPLTFNKKDGYDLADDYIGFMVAGRYHPSGFYHTTTGEKLSYDDSIIKVLFKAPSAGEFYRYFYLAPEDLSRIELDPLASFSKKLTYPNVGKAKRHLNVLFLDALRDVRKDFHYGYNSIVSQLIRSTARQSGELTMVKEVSDALKGIRDSDFIPKAKEAFEKIESRLSDDKVNFMPKDTQLVLGTPEITLETIGKYYNFLVNIDNGGRSEEELEIVGLGKQNLAYISSLFALFELKKEIFLEESEKTLKVIFNLLLIEEPEAHLDVQNQKHLHTQIEKKTSELKNSISAVTQDASNDPDLFRAATQVIQTSHSTHLTSKADLRNVVVLDIDGKLTKAVNIDSLLREDEKSYNHNRRILKQYLDATRSSLLFARKVVLVEGLSEKYLLPTFINCILRKGQDRNRTTSIDGEGIEIVEVGGKNFRPFEALYSNTSGNSLSNKCLCVKDGDFSPKVATMESIRNHFNDLNKEIFSGYHLSNLAACSNVFTFEIDTYFLPEPKNPEANNIDYLKSILIRLYSDGQYYKQQVTLDQKLSKIDELSQKITGGEFNPKDIGSFFEDLLHAEVSKPSLSLHLASLINAKETGEGADIWMVAPPTDKAKGKYSIDALKPFIFPEYLNMGIKWLITN